MTLLSKPLGQTESISVLIVDDHKMFVDGVESFLSAYDHVNLLEPCYSGSHLLNLLKGEHAIKLIFLDINLPNISGLDLCQEVKESYPDIKVVILSMYNEESIIQKSIDSGADGYLLKSADGRELLKAIESVIKGETYFCNDVKDILLKSIMNRKKFSMKPPKPKISRREKQIIKLITEENTTAEIADKLCLSVKTIEAARAQLLLKLNVRNVAGLVRYAYENNVLQE